MLFMIWWNSVLRLSPALLTGAHAPGAAELRLASEYPWEGGEQRRMVPFVISWGACLMRLPGSMRFGD